MKFSPASRRRVAGFSLLALLVACQAAPVRSADAVDPRRYDLVQDPVGAAAWEKAQAALSRNDCAAALPDLRVAIERSPDFVRAHLAYQHAARAVGGAELQGMLDYYRNLPAGKSSVPAYCRARLADTHYAQGTALHEILKGDPSFAWAHLSLARVYRGKGQVLQAVEAYEKALVNDPRLHEARIERAQLLVEAGRYEEAAVDYEKYLAQVPADLDAVQQLAELDIYRLRRIDQALVLLAQLEAKRGNDTTVQMDRAAAQWMAGDPRAAVKTYLRVLEGAPDNSRALLNIGLLYYEVLPTNPAQRNVFWPRARAAFELFLAKGAPQDGHEEYERSLAVPYRMKVIGDQIGKPRRQPATLADLALPGNG